MNPQHAESVALRALRIMAAIVQSQCNDADLVTVDGQTFTIGSALDTANALLEPAVVAESAEQSEAVAGLPLVIASAPEHIYLDLGELAHLIEPDTRFSDLADVTWSEDNATGHGIRYVRDEGPASPAAPAPCAMVGLTEDEQRQIWIEVKGTANGYGPVMDAAIRAFCQKNKLPEVGNG